MTELVKVTDGKTRKLKRFEERGRIIEEVNGKKLIVTELGQKHGCSAKGLTLMQNGFRAW